MSLVGVDEDSEEVHAVLTAGNLQRPPLVSFSFQGLAEPVELWSDLRELGWVVPPRPPRPASAIEWTGDGDNEFEVRAYRVIDYRIQPGQWPAESRPRIGALTVSALQRHGVHIHADDGYLQLIFPAQLEAERRGTIDLRTSVDPLPDTVILERAANSMARLCAYRTYGARSGTHIDRLVWAERARQVAQTELRAQRTVVKNALHAWQVQPGDPPEGADNQARSLRLIVPDVRGGSDLIATLRSHMGSRVGSLPLTPMVGSETTTRSGLLIIGVVANEKLARVRDVLLERHPAIFVRI